jgi:hypothetical protein
MNEYVLVEFLAREGDDTMTLIKKLDALGEDFIQIRAMATEWKTDPGGLSYRWINVGGKINSTYASVIKLQDPFLADRMRISYISDELKNMYRK